MLHAQVEGQGVACVRAEESHSILAVSMAIAGDTLKLALIEVPKDHAHKVLVPVDVAR